MLIIFVFLISKNILNLLPFSYFFKIICGCFIIVLYKNLKNTTISQLKKRKLNTKVQVMIIAKKKKIINTFYNKKL